MSALFGFRKATNRKTECYWLNLFGVRVLISYETPIAFDDWTTGCFRQKNHWGPTTGRHFRETGTDSWKMIEDGPEFMARLDQAIMSRILRDQELVKQLTIQVVTTKLVPEVA